MKIIHISDLHIGKRLNEFSLQEDQKYILTKIIDIVDEVTPNAVIIAGDVYDKALPSAEAVALFDDFLASLSKRRLSVFVISGNHDSPERIAFGGRLMRGAGVFMSPVYSGEILPVSLEDDFGTVDFFMLPFVKPAGVRRFFPELQLESYTDALAACIEKMPISPGNRRVLVSHQFVTGAGRCESEDISVGGADNVDASVFEGFDYVALGHLHGPQSVDRESLRYCGTPLKYSFSEANHQKSVTMVELFEKGNIAINTIPLHPLRDLRKIRGSYNEIVLRDNYQGTNTDDYMSVTLTDQEDVPNALAKLRVIYPNIMRLDYDNARTRQGTVLDVEVGACQKQPLELFGELFEKQNNQKMSNVQLELSEKLIEKIWSNQK